MDNVNTAEDLRATIVKTMLHDPKLGENYINWHTIEGECGLTIITKTGTFDLTIKQRN